jgi:predicted HTH domain antitoxin
MKTLQIQIPESLDENEVLIILAGKLYESGKLSMGQAAAIAGLSKRAFIEIIGKYGVSVFPSSIEDFNHDLARA